MKTEYLNPNDLKEILAIFKSELASLSYYNDLAKTSETRHYSEKNLRAKIEDDPKSIIVVKKNNEIVGFCFNRFDDYTIWLEWIIVKIKRQGIGESLLKKLAKSAKERECHKIWCDCRTSNEISKSFLLKNRFTLICEIPNHWYQQDFVLLQKEV